MRTFFVAALLALASANFYITETVLAETQTNQEKFEESLKAAVEKYDAALKN